MSKREQIDRYHLIIRKLRRFPASYKEINSYLENHNFSISQRTFQRDIEDIKTLYDIDIVYNRNLNVYQIEKDSNYEHQERLFEALDMTHAFQISDNLSQYVYFEKRKPQGTENLHGLLHAIKNKFQIHFTYQKYWEGSPTFRTTEPYALKEFKNRWYVLAKDLKDKQIKSFALDRLSDLEITNQHFKSSEDFDVNNHFKYCFGIISPNAKQPEKVVLSFTPHQGKYIKSLPLHSTQQILKDTNKELRIELTVFLTFDFLMELLSMGEEVKVISPQKLKKQICDSLKETLLKYENEIATRN